MIAKLRRYITSLSNRVNLSALHIAIRICVNNYYSGSLQIRTLLLSLKNALNLNIRLLQFRPSLDLSHSFYLFLECQLKNNIPVAAQSPKTDTYDRDFFLSRILIRGSEKNREWKKVLISDSRSVLTHLTQNNVERKEVFVGREKLIYHFGTSSSF